MFNLRKDICLSFDELINNHWKLIKTVLPQHTDHAGDVAWVLFKLLKRVELMLWIKLDFRIQNYLNGFEIPVISIQMKYRKSFIHGEKVF